MIKKTFTYINFADQEVTDDVYFNLTKAELLEYGIRSDIEIISKSRDGNVIMDAFKRLIKASYGTRTPDGGFVKTEYEYEKFITTEAYSEFFVSLVSDAEVAAEFVNSLMPAGFTTENIAMTDSERARANSEAQMRGHQSQRVAEPTGPVPPINHGQYAPAEPALFDVNTARRPSELIPESYQPSSAQEAKSIANHNQQVIEGGRVDNLSIDMNTARENVRPPHELEQEAFDRARLRPRAEEGYGRHQ